MMKIMQLRKEQGEYDEYEDTVKDLQGHLQMLLFDIEPELQEVWPIPSDIASC